MKNSLKLIPVVAIILTLLYFLISSPSTVARAVPSGSVVYAKTAMNVRETPSTNSKIIGILKEDASLPFLEKASGWYKVSFKGKSAYISANVNYTTLKTAPSQPETIPDLSPESQGQSKKYIKSKVTLNVRSTASTTGTVVGQISQNDLLVFKGEKDGWYQTFFRGKTAYVSANSSLTSLVDFIAANAKTEIAIARAEQVLGSTYVFGATRLHDGGGKLNSKFSTSKFDCSSLTQYAFYSSDVLLATSSRAQSLQGAFVEKSNLKRGDLLFFTNSDRKNLTGIDRIGHVGIYLGDNYILHTSTDFATAEPISNARWNNYITARRFA